MSTVHETIEVDAPIDEVFEAYSRFEDWPRFMDSVREVVREGSDETVWTTAFVGVERTWRARTTRNQPPEVIAWEASGDVGMGGIAKFTRLAPERTHVDVEFTWVGSGVGEGVAAAVGLDAMAVKGDLKNFKEHVERRRAKVAGPPGR